jgi:3-oxosteroid 1-dehydrogenase
MVSLRHPEETFDVVVIGSGAAGLTAALTAAHHGAKVVVLEKGHLWGGTSATSGGTIWIPNNHLIAPAGGEDNPADAFRYIRQLAGDDASAERVQARPRHRLRVTRCLRHRVQLTLTEVNSRLLPARCWKYARWQQTA